MSPPKICKIQPILLTLTPNPYNSGSWTCPATAHTVRAQDGADVTLRAGESQIPVHGVVRWPILYHIFSMCLPVSICIRFGFCSFLEVDFSGF